MSGFREVLLFVRGFLGRGRRVVVVFVCVAIHLKNEESDAGEYQPDIRQLSKALKGFGGAPDSEKNEHDRESSHLPELDTHVKGENARDQPFLAESQFLEPGRQTKAMNQAEKEDHDQKVLIATP